jgi:hypothetical protein
MNQNIQDLVEEFNSFRPSRRAHADFFLRNGRLHPEAHWVIQERLAKLVRRVEAGGPALRAEVLEALGLTLEAEEVFPKEFPAELEDPVES